MALLRIVAVVVIVIGSIGIAAALWAEKKKEQQWVSSNAEITARIKPFEEEKRVLEKQDKEWLQRLENTRNGGTCVLLGFASANQTLTQDTLQIMTEYGYRGTFPLQNGLVPGSSPELMSMEAFHGMLGSGWEYVFQTESPGGEDEEQWIQQLDAQIAAWNGAGIGTPGGYFFSEGQSSESKEEDLRARGFSVWAVPQQSGGYIGNLEDGVLPVKTVVVSKHAMTMESALTNAISKKKSVAFLFPEVTSQIEGDGEAITPETFRKLLSEIKEKEMAGALQVMTYYQYYQYRVQCQAEAEALKLEYEIFCQQKDARIKELDEEIRNVLEEYR